MPVPNSRSAPSSASFCLSWKHCSQCRLRAAEILTRWTNPARPLQNIPTSIKVDTICHLLFFKLPKYHFHRIDGGIPALDILRVMISSDRFLGQTFWTIGPMDLAVQCWLIHAQAQVWQKLRVIRKLGKCEWTCFETFMNTCSVHLTNTDDGVCRKTITTKRDSPLTYYKFRLYVPFCNIKRCGKFYVGHTGPEPLLIF